MYSIWQFSSYSEPLVQKLLETAVTLESENKWNKKFGHINKRYIERFKLKKLNKVKTTDIKHDEKPISALNTVSKSETVEDNLLQTKAFDAVFCNTLETEPLSRIEYLIEECLKRPDLITDIAEHLTMGTIEKICNSIYAKENVNAEFISLFLRRFFPVFLKREQTWLTLDLLLKANKTFPESFEPVLIELINDVNIKSSILQEFTQTMGAEFQKHLLSLIMHMDINSEIFVHHLHTLYLTYKDCTKAENVQEFIQSKLIQNAPHCANDKIYGRLFLTFLQEQKGTGFPTKFSMLDTAISQHKTPFQRPCLNILKDMMESNHT